MLNQAFIANRPADTDEAVQLVCRAYSVWNAQVKPGERIARYEEYVDAFSFLVAFARSRQIPLETPSLNASDKKGALDRIDLFFDTVRRDAVTRSGRAFQEHATKRYSEMLGSAFFYEFPREDLARIRRLINELKNELWKMDDLDEDHKARLRVRFAKILPELHEDMDDLDRFHGLIGEAGVLMAKLGPEAKPLVDRIKRILGIVLKTQARAEGIPARKLMRLISFETLTSRKLRAAKPHRPGRRRLV